MSVPDLQQAQGIIRELLATQQVAVLATASHSQPHTSLVAFLASDDLGDLFFATERATRKFANLSTNPHVALLLDSRAEHNADFYQTVAATAIGQAAEVVGPERESLLLRFVARHPRLDSFVRSTSCALVRVRVERYSLVTAFQQVVQVPLQP